MGLRIALISSSYAPYPGGVEEHTRNVARELYSRGHEVEVWTVDRGEHLGTRVIEEIPVRYLPTPLPSATVRGLTTFARVALPAWSAWRREQRRFRPDILHIQCFGPNGVYAWALHRTTRIPLILSSHGETFADEDDVFSNSRILSSGLIRALHDATAVTGCSSMVIEDLRQRFALRDGSVVPNGVDPHEAEKLGIDLAPRDPEQPLTVFCVGRMVRVKGFDLLITAFARAHLPETARLVIGGDGPELPDLHTLTRQLGIEGRVDFPGRLTRREVILGMANADVIAVPSRSEAFGIVVLEAWRSGTALLATSSGGPGELVIDGVNGVTVDPTDTAGLADALSHLLTHASLRGHLSAGGLRAVESFTWDRVTDLYTTLYRKATDIDHHAYRKEGARPCPTTLL